MPTILTTTEGSYRRGIITSLTKTKVLRIVGPREDNVVGVRRGDTNGEVIVGVLLVDTGRTSS